MKTFISGVAAILLALAVIVPAFAQQGPKEAAKSTGCAQTSQEKGWLKGIQRWDNPKGAIPDTRGMKFKKDDCTGGIAFDEPDMTRGMK